MNTFYRSVYNEALRSWVATSEVCAAQGKKSSSTVLAAGLVAVLTYGGASSALAANECGAYVGPNGTVNCTPATYTTGPNDDIVYSNTDGITLNINDGGTATLNVTGPANAADLPPSAVPFITRKSGVARLIDLDLSGR